MKRIFISLVFVILSFLNLKSQNSGVIFSGYLTNMQSAIFEDLKGDWVLDNLIHNRLNFQFYSGSVFSMGVEMRNRIFTGDMVRMDSDYPGRIGQDPGFIDLSTNIFIENSFIVNNTLDRLWLDLSRGIVQFRIGRQRINWGQTFVWNPNDVFNAYSYFDFDYAERPGSDAIRLQIYPNFSSAIEIAAKIDHEENVTAALLYRFNKWNYDIQVLGGYAEGEDDYFAGLGWSGAFGSTSFRGEFTWFQPGENFSDTTGTGLFTLGFDRSYGSNGMMQLQVMYCNKPLDFSDFNSFYSGTLSAKDLAFSEFSLFTSVSIPFSPLINLSLSAIWYPGLAGFFAGPSLDISIAENLDFSMIWQHFNADLGDTRTRMNLGFLRMKYSF